MKVEAWCRAHEHNTHHRIIGVMACFSCAANVGRPTILAEYAANSLVMAPAFIGGVTSGLVPLLQESGRRR